MNLAAPSLFSTEQQNVMQQAVTFLLNENKSNLGLLVLPAFAYKRNTIWLLEHNILKSLAEKGANVDRGFSIIFGGKEVQSSMSLMLPTLMNNVNNEA
jgi:hypothetical protein